MKKLKLILSGLMLTIILSLPHMYAYSAEGRVIKSFEIKPSVCVIERRANCEYQFVFSWELYFSTQVCLSHDDSEEILVCGNELKREIGLNVNLAGSTVYNLTSVDTPQDKKTSTIDVQRLGVDSRVLQRRIWSVF